MWRLLDVERDMGMNDLGTVIQDKGGQNIDVDIMIPIRRRPLPLLVTTGTEGGAILPI